MGTIQGASGTAYDSHMYKLSSHPRIVPILVDKSLFVGRGRHGGVDWVGLVLLPRYSLYADEKGRSLLSERWTKLKSGVGGPVTAEAVALMKQRNFIP